MPNCEVAGKWNAPGLGLSMARQRPTIYQRLISFWQATMLMKKGHAMPQYPTELYGVIGYPLSQTLSPALHNWGFRREGINAAYFAWPVAPEKLPDFISALRLLNIRGVSITIPHKQTVIPFLDGMSDAARHVGAVNTLHWKDGKLLGENTDVSGFCVPLQGKHLHSALVLGAGGAARAVVSGLAMLGINGLFISSRRDDAAQKLAEEFGAQALAWDTKNAFFGERRADESAGKKLVVNTTPLGMKGKAEGQNPLTQDDMRAITAPSGYIFYDIVYNPLETAFLAAGRALGVACIDGLDMFAGQGLEQFKLWTSKTLPLAALKDMLRAHL